MTESVKVLVAALVGYVCTQLTPWLVGLGLDPGIAQEISSWGGNTIWALSAILWILITHSAKLTEIASIAVAVVEAGNPNADGQNKKKLAIDYLRTLIDKSDLNLVSKKICKMLASTVIEKVVAVAKDLLYKDPPLKEIESEN